MLGIPKFLQDKLVKQAAEHLRKNGHEYLIIKATESGKLEISTPENLAIVPVAEYEFLKKVYQNQLTIKTPENG